ncbi:MAG: branched-chain-amino-acid transaminase [Spirochaetales bacterium]|nr:branched-chain-amino-acid transaminase [Spirochaetales bacterium]
MLININGTNTPKEEAGISVFDHGFLYGDGVFEGLRVYNGRIFKSREHLQRLYESAQVLCLKIPLTMKEMSQRLENCLKEDKTTNAYIRLIVTRGVGALGIDPRKCEKSNVIIIISDISLYPKEYYKKGIAIITASVRRNRPDTINPRIKSLNYLNNILAKIEAQNAGCMEALLLNDRGFVAECTADNIFMVKKGRLYTPPVHEGALEGITRQTILDLAEITGLETHQSPITQFDLYTADEVFMSGTACELMAIIKIDGRTIGTGAPGPEFKALLKGFQKLSAA